MTTSHGPNRSQGHRSLAEGPNLVGIALAIIAAVSFGVNIVLYKTAFNAGATPLTLLATRLLVATLAMLAYHPLRKYSLRVSHSHLVLMLSIGGIGFTVGPLLFAMAVDVSRVSVVAPLFFTYPLWTSLVAASLRMTPLRLELIVALLLGMTGVLLLFSIPQGNMSGLFLALAAGFTMAMYFLFAQVLVRSIRPSVGATFTTAGGAILFVMIGMIQGKWVAIEALPWVVAVGLLTALGYLATFEAIARIGAAHSAVVQLLEPVTSVVLAYLFLGERLSFRMVFGAALVLCTVPLVSRRMRQQGGLLSSAA